MVYCLLAFLPHTAWLICVKKADTTTLLTMAVSVPSRRDEFEIAIICAQRPEYDAVSYIFDKFWDDDGDRFGRALGDPNSYTTGCIGKYNVVLALLPHEGNINAASVAASLRSSYSSLRLALLVGVCGGMPRDGNVDILLGDVVISKTVKQYNVGWLHSHKFVCKNTVEESLGRPNKDVRTLLAMLETDRGLEILEQRTSYFFQQIQAKVAQTRHRGKYDYPGAEKDKLYKSSYRHKHHVSPNCICRNCVSDSDLTCSNAINSICTELGCDDAYLIPREQLKTERQAQSNSGCVIHQPAVHLGSIASGDATIKSAADRDTLSRMTGVIAFEMEGAGIWDEVPCIIVKGVCDYADGHTNEVWQNFAAATAASASKAILERYIQTDRILSALAHDRKCYFMLAAEVGAGNSQLQFACTMPSRRLSPELRIKMQHN